jgi:hypothetical protein
LGERKRERKKERKKERGGSFFDPLMMRRTDLNLSV